MTSRSTHIGIYRSKLEHRFAANFNLPYEITTLNYLVPSTIHTYTPDFTLNLLVHFETKGRFSSQDRQKMLLVKSQHSEKIFVLIFQRNIKLGTRLGTCLEWAKKNGFPAFLETDHIGINKFIEANTNRG
jgi:hypothetical protein